MSNICKGSHSYEMLDNLVSSTTCVNGARLILIVAYAIFLEIMETVWFCNLAVILTVDLQLHSTI